MPYRGQVPSVRVGYPVRTGYKESFPLVTTSMMVPSKRTAVPSGRRSLWLMAIVPLGAVLGAATTLSASVGAAVAVTASGLIAVLCVRAPQPVLVGVVVWLVALGTLRRIFRMVFDTAGSDPLLLIAPAVVVVLVLVAAGRQAFRSRTSLSKAVILLSGLIVLGVFNPLQGGLAVGLSGLIFVLVPILWFWVGRGLMDDRLFKRLLTVVAALAPLAALYGLLQVYQGLPPWDAEWLEAGPINSLRVGDAFRQWASFSAASEYVVFLAVGAVIWVLHIRRARWAPLAIVILSLLGWALAVASVRSITVVLVVTVGMLLGVARGRGIGQTVALGLLALMLLSIALSAVDPATVGGDGTSSLLSRQVTGLSDPFNSDPNVSTFLGHFGRLVDGVRDAVSNPVGRGTGSISIAADRFGEGSNTTEVDLSNAAVALGIPGLLTYSAVFFLGFRKAFRRARLQRDLLTLAALGILLITSLQWLNGGNYAVAPLPWLVLGWLDRPRLVTNEDAPEIEDSMIVA